MHQLLVKRWFLIVLLVGISATLLWTDTVRMVVEPIPLVGLVVATMFLVAWTLESRRLWEALIRPRAVIWALAISYILMPPLGWLASRWFSTPDLAIGLIVVTSVPCTLASAAIWTRLAGGNEAAALLITLLTTALSWLITTAWLTWLTGAVVQADPIGMMRDLALFLVVPVTVGQLARGPARLRILATRWKTPISVITRLLVFLTILHAVIRAVDRLHGQFSIAIMSSLLAVALACTVVHLLGLVAGYWSGNLIGLERGDRIAVAFGGSQKTLPVSMLLIDSFYPGYGLAVVPALFYHVGQLVVDTLVIDLFRHGAAGERVGTESAQA